MERGGGRWSAPNLFYHILLLSWGTGTGDTLGTQNRTEPFPVECWGRPGPLAVGAAVTAGDVGGAAAEFFARRVHPLCHRGARGDPGLYTGGGGI